MEQGVPIVQPLNFFILLESMSEIGGWTLPQLVYSWYGQALITALNAWQCVSKAETSYTCESPAHPMREAEQSA